MENTGGMVAVVQGLRNSGLTVTLLDGGKQYTLVPESAPHPTSPQLRNNPSDNTSSRHQQCATDYCVGPTSRSNRQDNGVQATDGRYASTYKMMHCNVSPTSPPQNVTEFPPQRSEVIPGHSNFVVGGYGSGESVHRATKTNSFRGAMCWPDRGSVCMSKPSVQPDAFANSLRKYPSISPERSTEIVERLISFTQAKNISKNLNRSTPPRNGTNSESSKETYLVENNSKSFDTKPNCYPDVTLSKKNRSGNSPVRERSRDVLAEDSYDYWNRPLFCRDNEVRCFRDATKKVKDGSGPMNVTQLPKRSSSHLKEQYDNCFDQRKILEHTSNNSVNIEIQAAAQMESKEILTLPRIVPMQRTIATAISPVSSNIETRMLSENSALQFYNELDEICNNELISADMAVERDKYKSNFDYIESGENKFIKSQRSRSKEEVVVKKDVKVEMIKLLKDLKADFKYDVDLKGENEPRNKRIKHCLDRKPLFTVYDNLRRSVSDNVCYYNDYQFSISHPDTSNDASETLRDCVSVKTYNLCDKCPVKRDKALPNNMKRPRYLSSSTNTNNSGFVDVSDISKETNKIYIEDNTTRSKLDNKKKYHKKGSSPSPNNNNKRYKDFFTCIESIKEPIVRNRKELRNSIDLGILAFTEKYRLHITTESLYKLREEILDIILMNFKSTSHFNKLDIRRQIKNVLHNYEFNECYAARLANILMENWEDEFSTNTYAEFRCSNIMSDTFIVLPNINVDSSGYQGTNNNVPDYNINQISQKDIDANINEYMNQVSIEINRWLSDLHLPQAEDEELRQSLLTNLATDIVDRQKYLELNPSSESDASELEYLKYQIFKWMYKLIGDNNMTPVERASELMERIKTIPVPLFFAQLKILTTGGQSNQNLAPGSVGQNVNVVEPSNFGASSTKRLSTPPKFCCNRPTCKRNINKVSPDMKTLRDAVSDQQTTSTRRMSSPGKLYSNVENGKGRDLPSPVRRKSTPTDTVYNSNKLFSGGIKIRDDEKESSEILTPLEKSYKELLIECVKGELPRPIESESRHSDLLKLYEDLQILNLVEEFIMCSRYQNEDKVMSEAYRSKLVKHAEMFVQELKENYGKALMNIDANLYINNILDALQKVPLPSNETIQGEADEILLGLEIEKWFSELPLVQNDDLIEQLHRRRLRKHLAIEIHNIENKSDNPENTLDNTLRHEVSLFLERAPLQYGESLNINSMVEELIKRLKTRPKNFGNDTKKVGFHETDYKDFSENLPFCSSFADNPRVTDGKNADPTRSVLNNKSVQAIPTGDLTFRGYYNIARPLLDDIKQESKCCETDASQRESPEQTLFDSQPRRLQNRDDEPQWYTLQENTHEYPQVNTSRSPVLYDRSHYINNREHPINDHYNNPEQFGSEYVVPQQYKREALNKYTYEPETTKRFVDRSPMASPIQNQDASRRLSNQMESPKIPNSYAPAISSRRRDSFKLSQDTRPDIFIPQRQFVPYPNQRETERNNNISMHSPGLQDIVEESHSPRAKPSDLFYRSTDHEGIRRTIDRNRNIEANLDNSAHPEHYPEYYTPSMGIPPGYIPVRMGRKTFTAEKYPEDSEEDIADDEIPCKCVEKLLKSRRRPKYCPLGNIEGYAPCISPPYYYPYFY